MKRISYLKKKIIDNLENIRYTCPCCNKIFMVKNETQILFCDRCKNDIKFYKKTFSGFELKAKNDMFEKVLNCEDENVLLQIDNFENKLNSMNTKEYNDYLNK